MVLFSSEKQFAAGGRDAFDGTKRRRPLSKARGGLPEESDDACTLVVGSVERGGIRRRVSKGGYGVRHLPGKTVLFSLLESDPSLSLTSLRPRE